MIHYQALLSRLQERNIFNSVDAEAVKEIVKRDRLSRAHIQHFNDRPLTLLFVVDYKNPATEAQLKTLISGIAQECQISETKNDLVDLYVSGDFNAAAKLPAVIYQEM